MKNCYIITLLLLGFNVFQIAAQAIDFGGDIRHFKTTKYGRYLILSDGPITGQIGNFVQHYQNTLVYDAETQTPTFAPKNTIYGGFSNSFTYSGFSKIVKGDKAFGFKNRVAQLNPSSVKEWSNEHFIIGVYDDGKILATNAKIAKKYAGIKSLSGLYIYNPATREVTQIMNEKVDLEEYMKEGHQFSTDYQYSWKTKDGYEIYDLLGARKINVNPALPNFGYGRTKLSSIDGFKAIISRTRYSDPIWDDYYFDAETGELILLGDQNKPKVDYKFIGGIIYSVDATNRVVSRLKKEGGQFEVDASWSFSSIDGTMKGTEYRYELLSEVKIAAVPIKQKPNANMLLVDLRNNQIIDDLNLYPSKVAVAASPKPSLPQRPLYNSNLLNSYNLLRLPWALDYNNLQGRSINGLDGANEISMNNGSLSAIGEIGQTQEGDLILLSMWRGIVSGSDVSWFKVSIFGTDGTHKQTQNIGVTQKSMGAITAKIEFNVKKEGSTTVISAYQTNGNSLDSYKLVIDASGDIVRTSN